MQKQWVGGCAFALGMGAVSFCLAADNELSAGAGINYSAGKYGTGSTDESVQVDVYQTIERTTVFADVGYTHFGHSDVVQLDNAVNYGIGASQKLTSIDSLGASLDGRQRVTPGGGPQRELTLFWNRKTEGHARFQAYVLFGFANGSPDRGFGVSLLKAF